MVHKISWKLDISVGFLSSAVFATEWIYGKDNLRMDYIMGLSGAGSTTNINIATVSGVVLDSYTVGAINFFFASENEAAHNLAEAFITAQLAGYPIGSCRQVCAGVAGLHGRELALRLDTTLRTVMRKVGYHGDALLTGDEQIALAGALGSKKGAILVADDTAACYGQNHLGTQHRTGGLGGLADDDGSAYAIGREILRAVARAVDGRGFVTRLTAYVYRQFALAGTSDFSRLMRSETPTPADICELAGVLSQACQQNDRVALAVLDKTVAELVTLVSPVIGKLAMQKGTLAVAGKVLLNDAYVGIAFKKALKEKYPDLHCVPPRSDAAAGAVLMAKERLALRGAY